MRGELLMAPSWTASEPHLFDTTHWAAFTSAATTGEYCQAWLSLLCCQIAAVRTGGLLLEDGGRGYASAAAWPAPNSDLRHLGAAAEMALTRRQGAIVQAETGDGVHLAFPLARDDHCFGVIVVELAPVPDDSVQNALRQMHWGSGWLDSLVCRRQLEDGLARVDQAALALDLLAVAHEHGHLAASAGAIASELAVRLACQRVAVGLRHRGRMRLTALSHTAWFARSSHLATCLEALMAESADQRLAISLPDQGAANLDTSHRDYCQAWSAEALLTVPFTAEGICAGAITFERTKGPAFTAQERVLCELVAGLVGPWLIGVAYRHRWVAGRLADLSERAIRALFGPRQPALKLGVTLAVAVVMVLAVVRFDFRIAANSVIEGSVQRATVAPFHGYIAQATVRAGDTVDEGQVVALLDDKDLILDRARWRSELAQADQKQRDAQARGDRAALGMATAQMAQVESQLQLVEEKLTRTRITAPIAGLVVTGDLSQKLGTPVDEGAVLFEIAPLDAYRVILKVEDTDISHLLPGQHGTLALTGMVGTPHPLVVDKVTPVATAEEGRTIFRVEAHLDGMAPGLRPGMEGIAKVSAGRRTLLWITTRRLTEWARMTVWQWLP
jgi:multidrug efflux pump subunit AcrA (membrane-fusion protein)